MRRAESSSAGPDSDSDSGSVSDPGSVPDWATLLRLLVASPSRP